MAGRSRLPPAPNLFKHREVQLTRPYHHPSVLNPGPFRAHTSVLLEDRIAIQHREIQSLLVDNQRLAATHAALKHELATARQELRHLSATAGKVKAERNAEVREMYERSLKMDAEVRVIDAMSVELAQVWADIQRLGPSRQELAAELQMINGDLAKMKSDSQQVPAIKAEIEAVLHEIQRGRAAIEYEKKTRASNLEHRQVMEKNMITMSHEIAKLHAELANSEKRGRAAAAAATAASPNTGYAACYDSPGMGYGGSSYTEPCSMHQVQGGTDSLPHYLRGAAEHACYDVQESSVQS